MRVNTWSGITTELTPADQIRMLVPSVEDAIGAAEMAEHEHARDLQANEKGQA